MDMFIGELNGVTVNSLHGKFDYNKKSVVERLEIAQDMIDTGFFQEYFDNHYNYKLESDDFLSEDNNVCRLLERLADYILSSNGIETNGEFYKTRNQFDKQVSSATNLEGMVEIDNPEYLANMIHDIETSDIRDVVVGKDIKVTEKDWKDKGKMGELLREYNRAYMYLYAQLGNNDGSRFNVSRQMNTITQDTETIKESFVSTCGDNTEGIGRNGNPNLDFDYDFSDERQLRGVVVKDKYDNGVFVRGLIYMDRQDVEPTSPLWHTLDELDYVISQSKLSPMEEKTLKEIRKNKSLTDVAQQFDIKVPTVSEYFNNSLNKIMKTNKNIKRSEVICQKKKSLN